MTVFSKKEQAKVGSLKDVAEVTKVSLFQYKALPGGNLSVTVTVIRIELRNRVIGILLLTGIRALRV